MARFELTMASGEKLVVDHPASDMAAMRTHLTAGPFVVFSEIRSGTEGPMKDVIVATGQISILRSLAEGATQGSGFRPKR
ncbi:hypothetical protein [Propylenella binzhouense]|uniref:Uncharacterized protein n=1 Tax=Propylenella binzhouense TaxID=2555902 RepID=A0A964T2U1_9HYPH|nr:hypothetical protein [Propylenella binzhouense]MYZ46542.1 hypothetical protein [Propylenella binzhouense]